MRKTILRRIYAIFFVYLLKQAPVAFNGDVGLVAEKTQLVNVENSVNETTWKRCFVKEGVVVG